jgi:hypothetical protein
MAQRVSTLLWLDDQYPGGNALAECVGDRYLYANNPVFARVRDLFLSFGFRLIRDGSQLWQDYYAAPLMALQDLLEEGVVPYRDNRSALERLVRRSPGFTLTGTALEEQLERNYLLHESSHLCANRLLEAAGNATVSKTDLVLRALLCESFANINERLAVALAGSDTHVLLLYLNSYARFSADKKRLVASVIEMFGIGAALQIGLLAYLHTNTHRKQPDEEVVRAWTDTVFGPGRLTEAEWRVLDFTVRDVFTIRQTFRTETSPLFFRLLECESEFHQFCEHSLGSDDLRRFAIPEKLALLSGAVTGAELVQAGAGS